MTFLFSNINNVQLMYYILMLMFFIFTISIVLNKNLFYALFSLILVYIVNVIIFILYFCSFQGFLILLLYVGAVTVLFLFLIMLLDFRIKINFQIPFYTMIIVNFLLFFMNFLVFMQNALDTVILEMEEQGFIDIVNISIQEIKLNAEKMLTYNFYVWDLFEEKVELIKQGFLIFDNNNISQIFSLGELMYSRGGNFIIVLLVGFFSFLILLLIFSLLKKHD